MTKFTRAAKVSLLGFLVGVFVTTGGLAAYAATSYSNWKNWTSGSVTYTSRTYVTDSGGGVAGVQVKRADNAASPSGYLQAAAAMTNGTAACRSTGATYNSGSIVQLVVQAAKGGCPAGNYRSEGFVGAYNPSTGGYVQSLPFVSPFLYLP